MAPTPASVRLMDGQPSGPSYSLGSPAPTNQYLPAIHNQYVFKYKNGVHGTFVRMQKGTRRRDFSYNICYHIDLSM